MTRPLSLAHPPHSYNLNTDKLHSPYGHMIPPAVQDLLEITSRVMHEDRSVRRPRGERRSHEELRGWVRTLRARVEVREVGVWTRTDVQAIIDELLHWLSEDFWNLSYEQLPQPAAEQPPLFRSAPTTDRVVLYSGGLDSLAGAISLLEQDLARGLVLMSGINDSLRGPISRQVDMLKHVYGDRVRASSVSFELRRSDPAHEEETQRTRIFRFLAYGLAEAIACGASEVVVCENGIGSLNLPLNHRQLGTQHTRATHPKTLRLMTRLASAIGFPHIRFTGPFSFQTKGEVCRVLKGSRLERLVLMTVSCDSFPLRVKSPLKGSAAHCGTCTSCVLRRESLYAADIHSKLEDQRYLRDILRTSPAAKRSELEPLLMMLDQVTLIEAALVSLDAKNALLAQFSELTEAIRAVEESPSDFGANDGDDIASRFCDLLERYASEWREFGRMLPLT